MKKRQGVIVPVPASRWDHAGFYRAADSKEPPASCDVTLEKSGFIDFEKFNHSFGMTSAEAFHVPPSSMEVAFEALENANIPAAKIKAPKKGVFVTAAMDEGYIKLLFADKGW